MVSRVKKMPEPGKVVAGMYHHTSVPVVLHNTEMMNTVNKTWSTPMQKPYPNQPKFEAAPDLLLYSLSTFSFYFLQLSS